MRPVQYRLGLDSQAIAGGSGGRDVGQEQGARLARGGAAIRRVPVLGDKQGHALVLSAAQGETPRPATGCCHQITPAVFP